MKENSPVINYVPRTIKAFIIGGIIPRKFVRATYPLDSGEEMFFEVLREGNLNLYFFKEGGVQYFVQRKGESVLHSLPYYRSERYVVNVHTIQFKNIETVYHQDTLKMVMQDRPALYSEIEKIHTPGKKNLMAIVSKYNSDISPTPVDIHLLQAHKQSELLRTGKINLYMQKDSISVGHFYIQKGAENKLIELPYMKLENKYFEGLLIRSYANNSTSHIDTLKKYMAEAKPLFAIIDDIKVPSKNNMVKLVDEYNSYVDEDTFNKKHLLKRIPLNIDIVPGFNLTILDSKDPTIVFGALVDIGFVHPNKHYFFKTGLSVYTTDNHTLTTTFLQVYNAHNTTLKIPLQVEYRFSEKVIQPVISIGSNLYVMTGIKQYAAMLLPVITPGINIRMGKRFSFRLGVEKQFKINNLVSYFPTEFERASVFAGLQIKL